MANEIDFVKNEKNYWEASIASSGESIVVEITREKGGTFLVFGNLEGLDKVLLENFGPGADRNLMMQIDDIPEGVTITFISFTEVKSAKYV